MHVDLQSILSKIIIPGRNREVQALLGAQIAHYGASGFRVFGSADLVGFLQ